MGSPTLPAGRNALTDDIFPVHTHPPRARPEVVVEESALVREQADRTHQDVLQMLSKIKDEDPIGYHHALGRNDITGSTTVTGPGRKQSSPTFPVCVADVANLRRPETPGALTTSMQEPRPKVKGRSKKASTPDRLAGLQSSLLPSLLIVGAPPVLPLTLPAFSRKSRRLSQAKANLYFVLELPNLSSQRGGALLPSAPCLPLTLPLPSTRNIKLNNPLSYFSAVSTLQRYFFHGVPLPFFQRFFPFDEVLENLGTSSSSSSSSSRHQGGGDRKKGTGSKRSSLVWNIPQLFSPGYKYRSMVEQVWEGGKTGLRSSWVDAGDVLFAGKFLTLLGKISELEREAEGGRGGGGEAITLDITVVVRQYCYDGRVPMDIRRLQREDEPRLRGFATPAGPNFPDTPPEKRAVAQAEPGRPYHHYERHCGPVMVAKRKGLREEEGLATSLRAEGR